MARIDTNRQKSAKPRKRSNRESNAEKTALRFLVMLSILPRYPRKADTRDIAQRLEAQGFPIDIRSIQRDLKELSAFFPLYCDDRNKPFGWCWSKDAAGLDLPHMTPLAALTFQLAKRFLEPLLPRTTLRELDDYFSRANRILRELPHAGLPLWPNKVRIVPRGLQLRSPDVRADVQEAVYQALLVDRRLDVGYRPRDSQTATRYEINPLGLVHRHNVSYLVCTLWNYADVKQLALHRILSAELLDTPAARPADFDLDRYIEGGGFSYPVTDKPIALRALFDANTAPHLLETPLSSDQKLTVQAGGRYLLEARVLDTAELRWWLLAFGDNVEVLAPDSLRQEFRDVYHALARRYG